MPHGHQSLRVFVSSTSDDLRDYRGVARQVIMDMGWEAVMMEHFEASAQPTVEACLTKLDKCDLVVLIVAWRLGWVPTAEKGGDGSHSITALELGTARRKEIPVLAFLADNKWPGFLWEKTQNARDGIEKFREDLNLVAKFFAYEEPITDETRRLPAFRGIVREALLSYREQLPPEIEPGTPLAELIIAVKPDIRECIRKVTLIADCKRIHDCLHELLQRVIRPMREEVLSKWEEEETLSKSGENAVSGSLMRASKQIGMMSVARELIGREHRDLYVGIQNVEKEIERWTKGWPPVTSSPSKGLFAEDLDNLESYVEEAFREADRSMTTEETELRERYSRLREGLEQAQGQTKLSPLDHRRLDDELARVHEKRESAKNTLITHHRWQEAYDKLHELDSFRETDWFVKKLRHYREFSLPKLLDLVHKELGQAGATEPEQGAVASPLLPIPQASPLGLPDSCAALVDGMGHLKKSLEDLRLAGDAIAFDQTRKPFDDAFYCVDKRTLEEVSDAKNWVLALEEWLDGLTDGRRKGQ
jgi:hypothetical protein